MSDAFRFWVDGDPQDVAGQLGDDLLRAVAEVEGRSAAGIAPSDQEDVCKAFFDRAQNLLLAVATVPVGRPGKPGRVYYALRPRGARHAQRLEAGFYDYHLESEPLDDEEAAWLASVSKDLPPLTEAERGWRVALESLIAGLRILHRGQGGPLAPSLLAKAAKHLRRCEEPGLSATSAADGGERGPVAAGAVQPSPRGRRSSPMTKSEMARRITGEPRFFRIGARLMAADLQPHAEAGEEGRLYTVNLDLLPAGWAELLAPPGCVET